MFAPKFTINTSHRLFTIKHTDRDKGGGPFSTSVPDFFFFSLCRQMSVPLFNSCSCTWLLIFSVSKLKHDATEEKNSISL